MPDIHQSCRNWHGHDSLSWIGYRRRKTLEQWRNRLPLLPSLAYPNVAVLSIEKPTFRSGQSTISRFNNAQDDFLKRLTKVEPKEIERNRQDHRERDNHEHDHVNLDPALRVDPVDGSIQE